MSIPPIESTVINLGPVDVCRWCFQPLQTFCGMKVCTTMFKLALKRVCMGKDEKVSHAQAR